MGRPRRRRTLPLGDWQTDLARFSFVVGAGCTFALGRLDGKSDGTVFAIAVDKNAPSFHTYLANTARDAVVGQATSFEVPPFDAVSDPSNIQASASPA